MIRIIVAGAAMLAVMSASAGARADFLNGNSLYGYCSTDFNTALYCIGYIASIEDVLSAGNQINGYTACTPPGATLEQIKDVVMRYLVAHPESRHLGASGLVAHAIAQAFPCKGR
jgi:hypothetical protein